jgi:hypothetical protein
VVLRDDLLLLLPEGSIGRTSSSQPIRMFLKNNSMSRLFRTIIFLSLVFIYCSAGLDCAVSSFEAERANTQQRMLSAGRSYYPVKNSNPPAVILVHMLGLNRGDWNVYARHLQKEGIAVLSLDLRGMANPLTGLRLIGVIFPKQIIRI